MWAHINSPAETPLYETCMRTGNSELHSWIFQLSSWAEHQHSPSSLTSYSSYLCSDTRTPASTTHSQNANCWEVDWETPVLDQISNIKKISGVYAVKTSRKGKKQQLEYLKILTVICVVPTVSCKENICHYLRKSLEMTLMFSPVLAI